MSGMAGSFSSFQESAGVMPVMQVRRLGCLAACTLVLLVLGEGIAQVVLSSPSRQTFDAELGFRYLPNTVFFDGSEGGARLRLNSLGLNDAEPASKAGRPRIAVVGDSMTMAYQVPLESNYVAQLGQLRPDMEFVNISQADMGPVEYGALLRRHQASLAPDRVLFAFSYGDVDDVRRNPPRIQRGPDGAISALMPTVSRRQWLKAGLEPVIQRSALATVLMRRFGSRLADFVGRPSGGARAPAMTDAEVTEVIAFILRDAARSRPVSALFLPQIDYGAARRSRMVAASAGDAAIVARAAALAGIPLHLAEADLTRDYAAFGRPGHGFANARIGSGHLNPAGHAAVAQGIAGVFPKAFPQDAAER